MRASANTHGRSNGNNRKNCEPDKDTLSQDIPESSGNCSQRVLPDHLGFKRDKKCPELKRRHKKARRSTGTRSIVDVVVRFLGHEVVAAVPALVAADKSRRAKACPSNRLVFPLR